MEVRCFSELETFVQQITVLEKSRKNTERVYLSARNFPRGPKLGVSLAPCKGLQGEDCLTGWLGGSTNLPRDCSFTVNGLLWYFHTLLHDTKEVLCGGVQKQKIDSPFTSSMIFIVRSPLWTYELVRQK